MKISHLVTHAPHPASVTDAIQFAITVLNAAGTNFNPNSLWTMHNQDHLAKARLILLDLLAEHERGNLDL